MPTGSGFLPPARHMTRGYTQSNERMVTMSNTRKAKWTEDEITAANALDALGDLWDEAAAEAARKVIGGHLLADLERYGHEPGVIAEMERRLMALGTEFWAQIYRDTTAGSAA